MATTGLNIVENWARLNRSIVDLVDYIPDDKVNWSPRRDLHNFKGIIIHVAMDRNNWLGGVVQDGEETPDVLQGGQTREGLKRHLELSWRRVERFLASPQKLDAIYEGTHYLPHVEPYRHTGHWIAFHMLEHDVHHRADVFHYLALLEIEHPEVGTP